MSKEILNNSFQNKIINFIKMKQKNLIVLLVLLIFTLFGYFFYENLKKKMKYKFQHSSQKLLYNLN